MSGAPLRPPAQAQQPPQQLPPAGASATQASARIGPATSWLTRLTTGVRHEPLPGDPMYEWWTRTQTKNKKIRVNLLTVAMATIHSKYFSDEPTREQWIAQLVEAERERRKRQRMKEAAAATGETYTMPQQQTQTDRLTPVLTAVPRYPAAAAPRTDRPEQPRP